MSADHVWDLSVLYRSDNDPQIEKDLTEVTRVNAAFAAKWRGRTDYLTDPTGLLEALEEKEEIRRRYGSSGKPGYYFSLRSSQDLNDPSLRAKAALVSDVGKKNSNTTRFFSLALGKIPQAQQKKFLAAPELKKYHQYLRQLFLHSRYHLSESEEKIITLLGGPAWGRWSRMLTGFLAKEEREVLLEDGSRTTKNFSELSPLMKSQDKAVRDSAGAAANDILLANVEVAENELNAILETKKVDDELRGYIRPDQPRHLADMVDSQVVDTLVETVSARFAIAERFYQLKTKLLGLKKLEYHERGVEYGDLGGKFSYEQAVQIVDRALSGLDEEFGSIFRMFVAKQQIDVYPRSGKRGGAFCTFDRVTLPTYIMLNYTDTLQDVTTLAHEVGHGINDELIRQHQPPVYAGTPLSTAEVASTFMEDFVLSELSKKGDAERQLAIMVMKLNDDVSTIMRQIAAYKFERELHAEYRQRGYLSKKEIGEIFQKHMKAYMGSSVEQSPGSENWWVGWHHFRRPFYVYSYASGLLISKALQRSVKADHTFVTKVKDFLSAGLSDTPKNIFAKLGIDIEDAAFWNFGLDEIEAALDQAEKLAIKLGKI